MAKIPKGTSVGIFNNNSAQGNQIVTYLHSYGLEQFNYIVIPFDELTEIEVIERVGQAEVLVGPKAFEISCRNLFSHFVYTSLF